MKKRYSEEFKARAVADAEKIGVAAAARKHKVYPTSIYQWRIAKKASEGVTLSAGSEATGAGPLGACASITDPPPEPGPMDAKLKAARDAWVNDQSIPDSALAYRRAIQSHLEVCRLRKLLSLREQEIALLREQIGGDGYA